jgi:hypothetical protein
MPVLLDLSQEVDIPKRDKNYNNGVEITLTPEQKSRIVMTKFINTDAGHADWRPEGEWFEQVVADIPRGTRRRTRPRLTVPGVDGDERALSVDDGCIVDIVGKMSRVVGIIPGRPPMSEEEVDAYQEVQDDPVPMFQQWDFRITRVLKTNGPEGRLAIARSDDQKRADAQADMYDSIADAFTQGFQQLLSQGNKAPSIDQVVGAAKEKGLIK